MTEGVIVLIGSTYGTDGIGARTRTDERTPVWATIESIDRREFEAAGKAGYHPSLVFVTPKVNYSGEQELNWEGSRYGIYRTYERADSDEIELYAERKAATDGRS